MKLNLKDCFSLMVKYQASDLHLKVGAPPIVRKNGQLMLLYTKDRSPISHDEIVEVIDEILRPSHRKILAEERQVDFSYGVKGIGRFRMNIFYQRGTPRVVARNIPVVLPDYDSLNLPKVIRGLLESEQKGLILVTGATGCGKSSTIMAMLNDINSKWNCHILTIEDPIEFLIEDRKSLVTQRELGSDYKDYPAAFKSAMRQDPDVLFFGEIRDFDTMETALNAANSGHLVLSTLHTNNVVDTVHRVLGMVNPHKKQIFRMEFASSLKAIICQKLVMKKDGTGLLPVVELLINNPRVRSYLEDEERSTAELEDVIAKSKEGWGMQTFNQSLLELLKKKLITKKTALKHSPSPEKIRLHLSGLSHDNMEKNKRKTASGVSEKTKTVVNIKKLGFKDDEDES